jgi:hypothetical protein
MTLTVSYVIGDTTTVTSTTAHWTKGIVNPGGSDSTVEVLVVAEGPPAMPPYDPDRPQVTAVFITLRGDALAAFPQWVNTSLGGSSPITVASSAIGSSVGYEADSGSVRVRPRGGSFAQTDFALWYHAGALPPAFRIVGRIVAPELSP